jgi:diguanylate cyclase (GGDEF)-like protein
VVGLAASTVLAAEWRSNLARDNRKSFESTAADLNSTLRSKLDTTIGLTRTMRAIATMEPNAGDTRFLQWYQQLQREAPAARDVVAALIQPVPASRLPAFRRQAEADPAFRARLGGVFQIVPAGARAVYCLTRASVGTSAATSLFPPLLDYCAPVLPVIGANPYAALVRTVTDTGSFIVTAPPGVGGSLVAIGAAVYRRGAPLATVAARRAAVTGFIATSFNGAALIQSLLVGRGSLTLALYHRNVGGSPELIGRAGAIPKGRSSGYFEHRDLGGGWLVDVTGTAGGSVSADAQGFVVLGLGLLVTGLVFLLYRVLSRSRQRAWGLVGEKTDELQYRALHDPLTGLPNRTLVLDRAEQMLARARRLDVPVTALFMDIDGFKQINDRFGHQAGDEVLRQVGVRLKAVLRESDTVGRLGGDEFVMLVDSVGSDAVGPELVAGRILDVLRQPIELPAPAHSAVSATASIGIATGIPASAEDLLQEADLALYKAKAVGKDGYALFESAMQTAAQDRIRLDMDLADALEADQFFLVYQPVLNLENEQVVGVEALLRWRHPTRGVIAPDVFIPIAEENGLIVPIGRWVLEQACAQGAAWHHRGHPLNISVNVSARQLERSQFVEEVRGALRTTGLDPRTLTLEITETVLMRKPDSTAQLLTELKALGIRIAVDDFGTGYSSLAYLRQFPVDSVKIDRTFINGLAVSSETHALTHTLIQLGKALGLETLAEGVEQHSQARQLQLEGCDLAQGFLFARPLAADAVERFLEDGPPAGASSAPEQLQPAPAIR